MRWGLSFAVVADHSLVVDKNTLFVKNGKRKAPLRPSVFEVSDVTVDGIVVP